MTALCSAYESTYDAEIVIERLLAGAVPPMRITLISGRPLEDARDAPIGTFAGTTSADAMTVGSYANVAHSARTAMGTFAGDADAQRRGSFGDADRDTVTTHEAGVKRTRIVSHRTLVKLLVGAGLDQAIAAAGVRSLHAGRVLVLAHREAATDDIALAA